MTTIIYATGFEHGATLTTSGGGIASALAGTPVIDTTSKRTGSYGLHLTPAENQDRWLSPTWTANAITVGRFYVLFHAWPTLSSTANSPDFAGVYVVVGDNIEFGINKDTHKIELRHYNVVMQTSTTVCSLDTWYRVDFRINQSANPWVIDWQVNGSTETQGSYASAADTMTAFEGGNRFIDCTGDWYIDDVVISNTSGDYPIGPGGTEILVPGSDGTHNAGTNIIEAQDGTDIGTTTAYDKLNTIPMGSTTYYIQQASTGSNYADVYMANISATHASIIGAVAVLAYKSAATQANSGACIVTKDGWTTSTTVWGSTSSLADYSESSVFYKKAVVSGAVDDTTVNALEARVGYSGDANPDPYWIDLAVEVAYTTTTAYTMTAAAGAFTLTGNAATLLYNQKLWAAAGAFTLTGRAASLLYGRKAWAAAGSFAITGGAATLLYNRMAMGTAGAYTLTGNAANLLYARIVQFEAGSFVLTGNDVIMLSGFRAQAETGTFTLTGEAATILYNRIAHFAAGAFILTGEDAILQKAFRAYAETGTFTLTGEAAILLYNRLVLFGTGVYTLTGNDVVLLRTLLALFDAGTFVLSGQDATLLYNRVVLFGTGAYTLTGKDASLIYGSAKSIWGEAGAFILTGNNATLDYTPSASTAQDIRSARRLHVYAVKDQLKIDESDDWERRRNAAVVLLLAAMTLQDDYYQ